ncbi:FtsK/SpoIIIE domain-containing protein [Dietzia cinnamea]|nr:MULTISPECIES: FtsK/SpoIIIE domain-containing protein [Dietzia]MCT1885790.1 FtsK/SpoIIIE domain-containing protein [Dietzia cinnamea]
MVKNSRRKKRIRAAAAEAGSNYTSALRKDLTAQQAPELPSEYWFPNHGTPEFDEAIKLARQGILRFGPQEGGGWLDWNLNETPHGLFGGKTGSGKSVALLIVLFYAMYLPEQVEVIVCDPKGTEFSWATEFPSVIRYAHSDEDICDALELAGERLDTVTRLLNRTGVRKLSWLREEYAHNPELEAQFGPAPKRLIVVFDEIAEFLVRAADDSLEERKGEARMRLERIGRLGRAPEVNIVCTAQKPDSEVMSIQLLSQLPFRLGFGPLGEDESRVILYSGHGARLPAADIPDGRAWAYEPMHGHRQVQVMFLPAGPLPRPWDLDRDVPGARELIRDRLAQLGYRQVTGAKGNGGGPRWVRPTSAA